jgi:hypothetical protein
VTTPAPVAVVPVVAGTGDVPSAAHPPRPSCPSCGAPRPDRYCPRCGERRIEARDYSVRQFAAHVASDFTNLDGTLLRTVRGLLRPGFLTHEYFAGRRAPYMKPVQLFVFINVVFFLFAYRNGLLQYDLRQYLDYGPLRGLSTRMVDARLAERGVTLAAYGARFDAVIEDQKKTLMLVLVPVLALLLQGIFRRRYYVEHLVFSTHFFAFFLVFLTAVVAALRLTFLGVRAALGSTPRWLAPLGGETGLTLMLGLGTGVYLTRALRRCYGQSARAAAATAIVLAVAVLGLLVVVYKNALFFTTFYAT